MFLEVVIACFMYRPVASVLYQETFSDDNWSKHWKVATPSLEDLDGTHGEWAVGTGRFVGDRSRGRGLQTLTDAAHYHISAPLDKPVVLDRSKDVVIQFSVKHEQHIECGGGYLKLFGKSFDQSHLSRDSKYILAFGPDICGTATRNVKLELNFVHDHRRAFVNTKKEIRCRTDHVTHVYTFHLLPDDSYRVYIDDRLRKQGTLQDHEEWSTDGDGDTSFEPVHYVGFDLWQVKAGSTFDNILISDDFEEARQFALTHFTEEDRAKESSAYEAFDEERRLEQQRLQKEVIEERRRQDEVILESKQEL
eukprot:gb/GEZN01009550.1/.p1 GENE.gb/GEZN01009550.1/~~gb/GEZN01009550.1/.p1  ORF type:complete len:307 (+),score=36.18 gb/GEZN01009550.1/:195-1115(+)